MITSGTSRTAWCSWFKIKLEHKMHIRFHDGCRNINDQRGCWGLYVAPQICVPEKPTAYMHPIVLLYDDEKRAQRENAT